MAEKCVTEDNKKLCFYLKRVVEYLCKGCSIEDDAAMHILLDGFDAILPDNDAITYASLPELLGSIPETCESVEPDVLKFAIHTAGWLGENEDRFLQHGLLVKNFFRSIWKKRQTWPDQGCLTTLFCNLLKLSKHPRGLEFLLYQNEDVLFEGLDLLETGVSIFLDKAIIDYVTTLLVASRIVISQADLAERLLSKVLDMICHITGHYVTTLDNAGHQNEMIKLKCGIVSSLKLLENMCTQSDSICNCVLAHTQLLDDVFRIALVSDANLTAASMELISVLVDKSSHCLTKTIIQCLKSFSNTHVFKKADVLLIKLCEKGEIKKAQRLAVMLLKTSKEDLRHQCEVIILKPIKFVLGIKNGATDYAILNEFLERKMINKSNFTDILCSSLLNTSHCSVSTMDMIITLFKLTVNMGGCVAKLPSSSRVHLTNNRKLQRSCLQCLKDSKVQDDVSLAAVVVSVMRQPDMDYVTYGICCNWILSCLPSLFISKECEVVPVTSELALVLQHNLSAVLWELRDTTLEFLGNVLQRHTGSHTATWVIDHKLHDHVWQCVKDGESYVRASAVSTLFEIFKCQSIWTSLTEQLQLTEDDIIREILTIQKTDTEAFARRSALTFIQKYLKDRNYSGITFPEIMETVVKALQDFDWEVKLTALDIIDNILGNEVSLIDLKSTLNIPECAKNQSSVNQGAEVSWIRLNVIVMFDRLCVLGIPDAILQAVADYDKKVCEKASAIIEKLQNKLKDLFEEHESPLFEHFGSTKDDVNENCKRSIECCSTENSFVPEFQKRKKLTLVNIKNDNIQKTQEDLITSDSKTCFTDLDMCFAESEHKSICTKQGYWYLEKVLSWDVSKYNGKFKNENDVIAQLLSLMEDILSSSQKPKIDGNVDNEIDCY